MRKNSFLRSLAVFLCAFLLIGMPLKVYAVYVPYDQDTAMDDLTHVQEMNQKWRNYYVGALEKISEQLTTLMMEQVLIIGTFIDAQYQMDTQRLTQDMDTRLVKEYVPDTQMCIMGTNVRSLAMSDQKAKANGLILNNAMLTRPLLSKNNVGGEGRADDMTSRMIQYAKVYCNTNDNYATLQPLCGGGPANKARVNRDLDFTGLIDGPLTMDVDFTDNVLTNDEEDVLAMSRNLFASDVLNYIPEDMLRQGPGQDLGPASWIFQNARSLQAIRGVALNSFSHLVGMKAKTTAQSAAFMTEIIQELGVPEPDIAQFLGQNPSYFAQMDVLTKRIYMTPDFFVNLFTTPNNVDRLGATLQAVRLMSDRDRYEASLRREMLISLIVEMKLRGLEKQVDDSLLGGVSNLYVQ